MYLKPTGVLFLIQVKAINSAYYSVLAKYYSNWIPVRMPIYDNLITIGSQKAEQWRSQHIQMSTYALCAKTIYTKRWKPSILLAVRMCVCPMTIHNNIKWTLYAFGSFNSRQYINNISSKHTLYVFTFK